MHFSRKVSTLFLLFLCFNSMAQTTSKPQYIARVKGFESKVWGYVNENGKEIVKPKYERCWSFSEDGIAIVFDVETRYFFLIDTKGTKIPLENNKHRFIGADYYAALGFNSGLAAVTDGKLWGFIGTDGKVAIPLKYEHVKQFNDGYSVAIRKGGDFIILKANGQEVNIPNLKGVKNIKTFSNGLAAVDIKRNWGYLGTDGNIVIQPTLLTANSFLDDHAVARNKNGKFGLINRKGEWKIKPQFLAQNKLDIESGMSRVKKQDGNWAYVNLEDQIIEMDPNNIERLSDFSDGLAKGLKNGLWGFYNNNAEWIIEPKYQSVGNFEYGFAPAKLNDKWGMIDKKGIWIVQPIYGGINNFVKIN